MATGGDQGRQLTNKQIVRLAAAISASNMAAIAEGYVTATTFDFFNHFERLLLGGIMVRKNNVTCGQFRVV